MTRVAFLITGLERGGAESQLVHLARVLRTRHWDVTVFALRSGPVAADLRAANIPVHTFRPDRLLRFKPHILHAHLFHANITARLARLFLPIPIVISTIHSFAETSQRSTRIRHRDLLYCLTDPLADATVFVSRAAADRHRATSRRVIPNGIDTDRFRPDPERRARTRAGLALDSEFAWLAAGRLMWKKNYPLILEAMAKLSAQQPGALLFIAGEGPDDARLRDLAPVNVRFLGARTDMPDLMNAADAFVLSSAIEGLPTVLLEAAASGLPCVATAVGGVPEAVLPERTGYLVPPSDARALAAAMTRLAAVDRAHMSIAAREHALSHFDMRIVVEQWEQLYRDLLGTLWT